VDAEALVSRAESFVGSHGAVPKAELKMFRPHLGVLTPLLVERGLEVGSTIRRPLADQLLALADAGPFSARGLERHVAGATSREVRAAVDSLVAAGRLLPVVREAGPAFASAAAPVLDHADVRELLTQVQRIVRLLKTAARGNRRVLQGDVGGLVVGDHGRRHFGPPGRPAERGAPVVRVSDELVQEIARRLHGVPAPVHVPALLRSLGLTAAAGQRALLAGVATGLFELEPESGMARLSPEDAALCPRGPMGTHLSWVRARLPRGARS